jgi:subtilisin family serine protease
LLTASFELGFFTLVILRRSRRISLAYTSMCIACLLISCNQTSSQNEKPTQSSFNLEHNLVAPIRIRVLSSTTIAVELQLKQSTRIILDVFVEGQSKAIQSVPAAVNAFLSHSIEIAELVEATQYSLGLRIWDPQASTYIAVGEKQTFRTLDKKEEDQSTLAFTIHQGIDWHHQLARRAQQSTVELHDNPAWLTLDPVDFKLVATTSIAEKLEQKYITKLIRTIADGKTETLELKFTILRDPLVDQAWHLHNRGQRSFAYFAGSPGFDSRVDLVHRRNILGRGVVIRLVDTGLQMDHPDLFNQIHSEGHVNFEPSAMGAGGCKVCDASDPSPYIEEFEPGDQGTALAGIIAASGWNNEGSRGVAPEAKLIGFNAFSPRFKLDLSMLVEAFYSSVDVITIGHSFLKPPLELEENHRSDGLVENMIENAVLTHRDYKGSVIVKAAGDLAAFDLDSSFDAYNNLPWVITVGSVNAHGRKSSTALGGANIWISAPGGEAGFASDYNRMPDPKFKADFFPALISTDMFRPDFACKAGYAKSLAFFDSEKDTRRPTMQSVGHGAGFNLGWNLLNRNCAYTAVVHGTPAAAAVTSGVVALVLEANPDLSWREVKRILAKTAQPVDSQIEPQFMSVEGHKHYRLLPWIKNAAGYAFHNWYGFGLIDANKAVEMALSKKDLSLPPMVKLDWRQGGSGMSIPANNPTGMIQSLPMSEHLVIESVQIKVNIAHEDVSHLAIELISPSGTRSILLPGQSGLMHADLKEHVFLSNAFYGESTRGNWSIQIMDGKAGRSEGRLADWSIQFVGYYY